jgi:lipoprotein-anchoring transpeptidase ErfK/SrfK
MHLKDDVMWNSSRRIALVGASVVILAGGIMGFAWIADWLPISFGDAGKGQLVDESDLENELAGLTGSNFESGPDSKKAGSTFDDAMFGDQNEPIFEPLESPKSNEFTVRENWKNDRTKANKSRVQSTAGTTRSDNPFADFPSEAELAANRSIPDQFPVVTNAKENRRTSPFDGETEPHQLVDQASLAAYSNRKTSPESSIFAEGQTRSLSDARSFPSGIRQVGDEQPTAAKSPLQSPGFELAQIRDETANSKTSAAATEVTAALTAEQLKAKLAQIDQWLLDKDYVSAHRELSTLYWKQPELRPVIEDRLNRNSQKIYFWPEPHFLQPYEIKGSDLLQTIAPKYKLSWQYLAAVNQVDPRRIQAGKQLKVIKGPFSAYIDLSDFDLTVHCHGFFVKRYKIGIGKDNSSPIGKFKVLKKVTNPQYTDPDGRVIAGNDPTNPLGTHWIDIGDGFGIHGTLKPKSIGRAESRGCIRLSNADVSEVFMFMTKDSEVVIRQ